MLALTVSYDGRQFAGSQRQGQQRTVQLVLEQALSKLLGSAESVVFAGRTDAGVHAAGQVVSTVDVRQDFETSQMQRALNALLPDDVAVVDLRRREATFHARYDAIWREYRYRFWSGVRQPLAAGLVAQRDQRLRLGPMATAAKMLIGQNDLASFAGGGEGVPWSERQRFPRGTVRTVLACEVYRRDPWWGPVDEGGELIEIRIVADGFLPRMVRTIAGCLLEIGRGDREPIWIRELVAARDRRLAGTTAPAHGLILWRVGYPGDTLEANLDSGLHAESPAH